MRGCDAAWASPRRPNPLPRVPKASALAEPLRRHLAGEVRRLFNDPAHGERPVELVRFYVDEAWPATKT